MIVTIHQPNFMAWYPFFKKMQEADVFVILSHCQYEKNGDQNRFTIDGIRYTMSVNKGLEPIISKKYTTPDKDWLNIHSKLDSTYKDQLDIFNDCISENMNLTNSNIIRRIADKLNIKTEIVTDYETSLKSSERLLDLCKHYGATTYLSGKSGKTYLDLELFKNQGIDVIFQKYDDKHKLPILEVLKNGI